MADQEVKTEVQADDTPAQESSKEYTPIEQKALDMGWKPLEDYEGEPENYRSAEVFVALDPLLKRIEQQSKETKALRRANDTQTKMFAKIQKTEYDRAMATLRAEKRAALTDGDPDRVISIDEQIDDLRDQRDEMTATPQNDAPEIHPEFSNWVNNNSWYTNDVDMAAWADGIAPKLRANGMSPNEILAKLSKDVKEKFPNKFRNPNRDRAGAVEGAGNKGGGKDTGTSKVKNTMNSEERRMMDTIIKTVPGMTEEKYLAQYAEVANR